MSDTAQSTADLVARLHGVYGELEEREEFIRAMRGALENRNKEVSAYAAREKALLALCDKAAVPLRVEGKNHGDDLVDFGVVSVAEIRAILGSKP